MSRCTIRDQRGFNLVELLWAMVMVAIFLPAILKLAGALNMQSQVSNQSFQIRMLATQIKQNAKLIMDSAMTTCSQSMSTACVNDGWGWRDLHCQNTSPFPVFTIAPSNTLTYNIDTANFTTTVNTIINNIGTYCTHTSTTATTIQFNCASLKVLGIQYQTSSGPTANTVANTVKVFSTPHTNATTADFLNFLNFPTAVYIQYNKYLSNTGSTIAHTDMTNASSDPNNGAFMLDMTDLFLDRVKKTRDNMLTLDATLRNYSIGAMTSEFQNVPPNGLAGNDTFFVPWIWQALASSVANSKTLCNNASCGSFSSGVQWANDGQTATVPDVWLLLIQNLSLNTSYAIDAFGNPLRISLIANGCTGDVSSCSTTQTPPPIPQSGYLTAMQSAGYTARPPYFTLIVSPLCTSNSSYPDYCRWSVTHPN